MPKKRQVQDSESSDSDSGPDDREVERKKVKKDSSPPPAEKKGKKGDEKKSKDTDEEPSWPLGNMKFVKVSEFRGMPQVHVREYYEKNGELLPGKKGICLNAKQWIKLKESIDDVDKALADLG